MALKRNKRGGRPSPYPRFLFHGLRSAQLLSSIVVSGIMCYFMYYLRLEHFPIPWTFIILLTISIATIASLTVTIVLYNFTYLSPRFNLVLNGSISFFWALGLALLSWSVSTSHVLEKACTGDVWGGSAEAGVCRDYKALWGMTLVGTVSTFSALLLDIHTQRKTNQRGAYILPEDDKDAQRLNELKSSRVRDAGYDVPSDQSAVQPSIFDSDIGYHNRYGEPDDDLQALPHGPLEDNRPSRDMGYHHQFFRD
ncbi:hypothetical protein M430DRAFT_50282 [Amorphotheca resinae ATCC 22711]|uniref:MARVEL domain-containing protein n=1 Tax=Amorphotheca resinae ATCC 22711 TaxID=857342 RepID=A0A2T3B4S6_AMORE|nr:hypothetical protein M430DRAFT_50282 [Amorphotheca resinae ATCC 22711]PSS20633.1 hypothetical protein M430DRAFT_50282 [Amorphotheca resinae ATCC 22711]